MRNKLPRLMLTLFVAGIFFCSILPFAEPVSVIHDASCPLSDPVYVQSLDWMPPEASDQEREICEARGRCYEEKRPNRVEPHNDNGPPPSKNEPTPSKNEPTPSKNGPPPSKNGPAPSKNEPPPSKNGPPPSKNGPAPSKNEPPPSKNGPTTDNDNGWGFSEFTSAFDRVLFLLF